MRKISVEPLDLLKRRLRGRLAQKELIENDLEDIRIKKDKNPATKIKYQPIYDRLVRRSVAIDEVILELRDLIEILEEDENEKAL